MLYRYIIVIPYRLVYMEYRLYIELVIKEIKFKNHMYIYFIKYKFYLYKNFNFLLQIDSKRTISHIYIYNIYPSNFK